jgi:hypothetical protein
MRVPEPYELISFFGSEPVLADEGIPWVYKRVTFSVTHGVDQVILEVEASSGHLRVLWNQSGLKLLELLLNGVESLDIEDRESCLVVGFAQRLALGPCSAIQPITATSI